MSKVRKTKIRQTDKIVGRESRSKFVHSVIFPNRTEIGLDDPEFTKGLQVYGNISASGSLALSASRALATRPTRLGWAEAEGQPGSGGRPAGTDGRQAAPGGSPAGPCW